MKHIKLFQNWFKKDLKRRFDHFNDQKNKATPITISIKGKEIIYNPVDREILNDDNVGKYVVLNVYPFEINEVKIKDRENLLYFISNNIGKITCAKLGGGEAYYDAKYDNVTNNLQPYFTQRPYDLENAYLIFTDNSVDNYISDNYDDCLSYISSRKYNL